MLVKHFFTPGLFINSYLLFDEDARIGVLIDPTCRIEEYLAYTAQEGITITDILETHVHADFVSGAPELKAALGGKAIIHCSGLGGEKWTPAYGDHVVKNRDQVNIGSIILEAWHTPGHTPEHLMWVAYDKRRSAEVPQLAFTGDFLFVGSIGRPDLLGSTATESLAPQLYHSIFEELNRLPDFVEIYPAHGAGSLCGKGIGSGLTSTLGYEKKCNPWLKPQPYPEWIRSLELGSLPIPTYFSEMKHHNLQKREFSLHPQLIPSLKKEQLSTLLLSSIVIDVRRPDAFAAGNIPGSINIPPSPSLSLWAGAIIPRNHNLILLVDNAEISQHIVEALRLVGLDQILGILDISQWTFFDKKEWFHPSPEITVEALHREKEKYYLLDVRTAKEWDSGHIKGAHHLELSQIPQKLSEIPREHPIAVICHSGNRASLIASFLKRQAGVDAYNVQGGMVAWTKE